MSLLIGMTEPVLRALTAVDPIIAAEVQALHDRAVSASGIDALIQAHAKSLAMGSRD